MGLKSIQEKLIGLKEGEGIFKGEGLFSVLIFMGHG